MEYIKNGVREMIEKKVTVKLKCGLHLLPATQLAKICGQYNCKARIFLQYKEINVNSILNIVSATIKCGDEIVLMCDGPDEQKVMNELEDVLTSEEIEGMLL